MSKIIQFDHVAIYVANVAVSRQFYADVLQLPPIPRPAFQFPGAWFELGPGQQLHLIGDRQAQLPAQFRSNHFALKIDHADGWEEALKKLNIDYLRKVRPDGAHQIFLQDPDGYWIELCQSE